MSQKTCKHIISTCVLAFASVLVLSCYSENWTHSIAAVIYGHSERGIWTFFQAQKLNKQKLYFI